MALRAVADGETAPPKSVTEAAKSGDKRDLLVAMRDRIALTVENPRTPARDLASLSRRLMELAKEIEILDADERDDDIGAAAATPDEEFAAR